jgi:hypothetical protein
LTLLSSRSSIVLEIVLELITAKPNGALPRFGRRSDPAIDDSNYVFFRCPVCA